MQCHELLKNLWQFHWISFSGLEELYTISFMYNHIAVTAKTIVWYGKPKKIFQINNKKGGAIKYYLKNPWKFHWISITGLRGATSGAGTAYPSGAPESPLVFSGFVLLNL